mmetsp:Transcript_20316/g.30030  ORF Transcript_20316/g.30030 Transcript_20316/m.30030 type:complete len:80 (+) Transcript_20316:606-845(+)
MRAILIGFPGGKFEVGAFKGLVTIGRLLDGVIIPDKFPIEGLTEVVGFDFAGGMLVTGLGAKVMGAGGKLIFVGTTAWP